MKYPITRYNTNNQEIYFKCSNGDEWWYKWINNQQIPISQEEFDRIEFLKRKHVPRYEILDIIFSRENFNYEKFS